MRWLYAAGAVFALLLPSPALAQSEPTIRITSPASGEVLQGLVEIMGTSAVDGFFASELSFAYASDATNTWFLIHGTESPVSDGLLTVWDTTMVTDGNYDLRLRVTMQDGSITETMVTGLRIRNQTPTETVTPEPTSTPSPLDTPTATLLPPTPQPAPTSTRPPTPTSLPPNPVVVTNTEIYNWLGRGILVTLLLFILVGILIRLRRS